MHKIFFLELCACIYANKNTWSVRIIHTTKKDIHVYKSLYKLHLICELCASSNSNTFTNHIIHEYNFDSLLITCIYIYT